MPSYTVAYCVAYSLEWIDSLRLSSMLHALPLPPPQRPSKLNRSALISGTPSGKSGLEMSTPVYPEAMPLGLSNDVGKCCHYFHLGDGLGCHSQNVGTFEITTEYLESV